MNEYKIGWRMFVMHTDKRGRDRPYMDQGEECAEIVAVGVDVIPASSLEAAKKLALKLIPKLNTVDDSPKDLRVYVGLRYILERPFTGKPQ